jgi:uncharacterized protein YlaI
MAIRYLSPIPASPKEFVEPTPDPYFIFWLFRHRCVVCRHVGSEINEVIPRSRSKKSIQNWENRVLMCRECHREYHKHGVNSVTIEALQTKRHEFLMANGREEYANYVPLAVLA